MKNWVSTLLCMLLPLVLVACSSTPGFDGKGAPELSDPEYVRTPPPLLLPDFTGTVQDTNDDGERSAAIDMSNVSMGYVGVTAVCSTRVKFRIERGVEGSADYEYYDYDVDGGGAVEFFPLSMGNGNYTFTVFLQISGGQYEYFLTSTASVTLESEFAPFIIPNKIVNYNENSKVVQFSYQLAEHASNDLEVAQQIYYWIENNITYDTNKATEVMAGEISGYVPDPDEILVTQTGICYDYASLAAAMLRANGIPCKLVKGNVSTENGSPVYHAWNMVWLEDGLEGGSGWLAVEFKVAGNDWNRVDLTFASTGDDSIEQFIGDGNNYYELSVH